MKMRIGLFKGNEHLKTEAVNILKKRYTFSYQEITKSTSLKLWLISFIEMAKFNMK